MNLYVDQELCIACGSCIALCPEVYDWNGSGKADVIAEITAELKDSAVEAKDICPTDAIIEE
ncbi:ferredoxin [Desulfonispora thiosulfatigenes DSM 11270]|uniref:Ferredoxin n=1 Tax=Desulfonispora thiosulfatigenes DSM 11270 TaxID=656914 RepID=A0A1W1UR94_DESTI|nr:ferredoxin [Desulfonispora thiosulfatigenes]SMB83224.1 ferredoxin [Desulfonispora thiosulfatigenes DSM 11270]